ncbi:MAG: hypothetical protein GVY14_16025 [Spirochaetes bacterium]|nr:hypothetical protein [Spirochaetota bacterium]
MTSAEAIGVEKRLIEHFGVYSDGGLLTNLVAGATAPSWSSEFAKFVYLLLQQERQRLNALQSSISAQIEQLPKGSLSVKRRWNTDYIYLDKVGTEKAEALRKQIDERLNLQAKQEPIERELHEITRLVYAVELGLEPD